MVFIMRFKPGALGYLTLSQPRRPQSRVSIFAHDAECPFHSACITPFRLLLSPYGRAGDVIMTVGRQAAEKTTLVGGDITVSGSHNILAR